MNKAEQGQRMSRNVKECQGMSRNVKECQGMSRNVKECQGTGGKMLPLLSLTSGSMYIFTFRFSDEKQTSVT